MLVFFGTKISWTSRPSISCIGEESGRTTSLCVLLTSEYKGPQYDYGASRTSSLLRDLAGTCSNFKNLSREPKPSTYRRRVSRQTASRKGKETSRSCVSSSLSSQASFNSLLSSSWISGCSASRCTIRDRADAVVSVAAMIIFL